MKSLSQTEKMVHINQITIFKKAMTNLLKIAPSLPLFSIPHRERKSISQKDSDEHCPPSRQSWLWFCEWNFLTSETACKSISLFLTKETMDFIHMVFHSQAP